MEPSVEVDALTKSCESLSTTHTYADTCSTVALGPVLAGYYTQVPIRSSLCRNCSFVGWKTTCQSLIFALLAAAAFAAAAAAAVAVPCLHHTVPQALKLSTSWHPR